MSDITGKDFNIKPLLAKVSKEVYVVFVLKMGLTSTSAPAVAVAVDNLDANGSENERRPSRDLHESRLDSP